MFIGFGEFLHQQLLLVILQKDKEKKIKEEGKKADYITQARSFKKQLRYFR